ncbi:cysteine--tRNA ligase, partial [candidate division KSB1 bacterium]
MTSVSGKDIFIFNSASGKKEKFVPVNPGKVGMYVCGPTVYDYIHIGNARPLIVFDVIRKYFEYLGYEVNFVQNITDIDDKIIKKSNEEGVSASEIAEKYTAAFYENAKYLGVEKPDNDPRATAYIDQMIGLISRLIDNGFAYEAEGNVFFEVGKFEEYGRFSGKDLAGMEIGERVDEQIRRQKRDSVRDFALWKTAKPDEPKWDSPWGEGRPGWHTECVVMSTHILGNEFDIHGGGVDLIFPHHENEIAQARCGSEAPFARFWIHNEFLSFKGEKMAKSVGNVVLVNDLAQKYPKEAVRLFFLQTHYRKQITFDEEYLDNVKSAVERIYRILQQINFALNAPGTDILEKQFENEPEDDDVRQCKENIINAMNDDFNTAKALGA